MSRPSCRPSPPLRVGMAPNPAPLVVPRDLVRLPIHSARPDPVNEVIVALAPSGAEFRIVGGRMGPREHRLAVSLLTDYYARGFPRIARAGGVIEPGVPATLYRVA